MTPLWLLQGTPSAVTCSDIAFSRPSFSAVGLPDVAVKENRDRVKAAIKNAGVDFPARRITANLS